MAALWIALLAALILCSLLVGPAALSVGDVLCAFSGCGPPANRIIVLDIRVPRTILAVAVGASLGVAGAALQALTRNPLADPALFGAPQTAALFTVATVTFGGLDLLSFTAPAAGIAGALLSVLVLLALTGATATSTTVILAGVAISSLAAALTALTLNLSPNLYATLEITFWLMGSLEDRSLHHVALALPFMLAGLLLLLGLAPRLRLLTLGEEVARTLGVSVGRLRLGIVVGVALSVGAGVAVCGAIGFIGLIAPHLVRPFVAYDPARTVFASAPAGAALLLVADIAVRLAPPTADLKVGVITALIGAPFFLALLFSRHMRADAVR